jgi:tetratricopeptide (TPR) repeat protein
MLNSKAIGAHNLLIIHLERYLELCRKLNDVEGQGTASVALANAYQATNDLSKSIKYLEDNLALAESTNQQLVKAESSGFLGNMVIP